MQFFIDHKYKKIHQRAHAGDKCGFMQTPIDKREFTNSEAYIKNLEDDKRYAFCKHCETVQIGID